MKGEIALEKIIQLILVAIVVGLAIFLIVYLLDRKDYFFKLLESFK